MDDGGGELAAYYATAMAVEMDPATAAVVKEAQILHEIDVSRQEARRWRSGGRARRTRRTRSTRIPTCATRWQSSRLMETENARKRREEEQRDWNFAAGRVGENHANQQPVTSGAGPSGIHPKRTSADRARRRAPSPRRNRSAARARRWPRRTRSRRRRSARSWRRAGSTWRRSSSGRTRRRPLRCRRSSAPRRSRRPPRRRGRRTCSSTA